MGFGISVLSQTKLVPEFFNRGTFGDKLVICSLFFGICGLSALGIPGNTGVAGAMVSQSGCMCIETDVDNLASTDVLNFTLGNELETE